MCFIFAFESTHDESDGDREDTEQRTPGDSSNFDFKFRWCVARISEMIIAVFKNKFSVADRHDLVSSVEFLPLFHKILSEETFFNHSIQNGLASRRIHYLDKWNPYSLENVEPQNLNLSRVWALSMDLVSKNAPNHRF